MGKSTRRCTVQFRDQSFCDLASAEDMPFPICPRHALKLYTWVSELTEETREALVPSRGTAAPATRAERAHRNNALAAVCAGRSALYAIRCEDGVIKIGYTANLVQRINSYGVTSELIAFQFGTRADEQAIHSSLPATDRVRGREWYRPTDEVLAVVNDMRADFGMDPIAA